MDRIRNARHFAPRLQRWLDDLVTAVKPATADSTQLDLFGREGQTPPKNVYTTPVWSVPTAPSNAQQSPPVSPYVAPTVTAIPVKPKPLVAPPSDQPPKRQLMLGEFIIEYELRRSTRRSIGFMIDDDGLRVTAPKRVSIAEIDNAILTKQHWILTKLKERRERRAARLEKPPIDWEDGAQLPYLGGEITLRLLVGGRNRTIYNPNTRELWVTLLPGASENTLKERVKAWYQQEAKALFEQRLDLYASRLGVRYSAFSLTSAGTRWGSCTVDRKIRLNWKLIHFSLPLIDYVVAHELAHILEMNHSAQFWANVGLIYPEYEEAKNLLRKRSQELQVLFP